MNRHERRRGKWGTLNPRVEYDQLETVVGENSRKVLMMVLRKIAGDDAPFDERELWNSTRELINAGLMNIHFRFGIDGLEVRPEFLIPTTNSKLPA